MTANAEQLRIATYNTELSRDGPGLLLQDILSANDRQVEAVARVIALNQPDIILLQNIDYDFDILALNALKSRVGHHGHNLTHAFALAPNTGISAGLDMNGDRKVALPHDAQSYGQFEGQGGLGILSRFPIKLNLVLDFSHLRWKDFPQAQLPTWNDAPFPSKDASDIQRLSSTGHWVVPIISKLGRLNLLAFHAVPPVFDGPEDRNGLRNHDEVALLRWILDEHVTSYSGSWVVLGNANIDAARGEGRKAAIRALLTDARLQDPVPKQGNNELSSQELSGGSTTHTVTWPEDGAGSKRVSYILPDREIKIIASGVYWGTTDSEVEVVREASRHRLVWVDISLPGKAPAAN